VFNVISWLKETRHPNEWVVVNSFERTKQLNVMGKDIALAVQFRNERHAQTGRTRILTRTKHGESWKKPTADRLQLL